MQNVFQLFYDFVQNFKKIFTSCRYCAIITEKTRRLP